MKFSLLAASVLFSVPTSYAFAQTSALTFDTPQTAGISGLRPMWNTPVVLSSDGAVADVDMDRFGKAPSTFWYPTAKARLGAGGMLKPGALAFDAVHRSLLVRFPGAARKIAEELKKGKAIEKVELALPFKATELWPEGYSNPQGMSFLGDQWAKNTPHWHAVAWVLRRPWIADEKIGPTFNANINGASYWKKYGAQDEKEDRFPKRFGRAEVSKEKSEPLNVSGVLLDAAFGKTVEERLRKLEYCGFLIKKEEVYDMTQFRGGYEWGTARGGQGILIDTPKLVVTFMPSKATAIDEKNLALDFADLMARLQKNKSGGSPTAVVPSIAEFEKLKERLSLARPAWMKENWQWERVRELVTLQEKSGRPASDFPQTYDNYLDWLDKQLARAPRSWFGFDAATVTQGYFKYNDALPAPVKDHWKLYWWAWLMPDREYSGFDYDGKRYSFAQGYVGGNEMDAYQKATGDWRGNASVYRTYIGTMGTMNFNHWATAGVLLGGNIIGDEKMMAGGRRGLEDWPLRMWSWYDGSTQESIDHYYFSESLTAQKVFADYGPTPADRMMGQSIMTKGVEELASAYHPNLRRMVSSSGRTGIAYVLGIQDGLQHILHTLSPSGAETDLGVAAITAPNVENMPATGHNFTPGMAASQTLNGSWAPEWFSRIVDDKPLPYEFTNSYKQWGSYNASPLWKRGYMGRNYGMASLDISSNEAVPFMAQWRRDTKKAASMTDLGTLIVRGGYNRTDLLDSVYHGGANLNPNGIVGNQGQQVLTFQDKNRAIVLTSPFPKLHGDSGGRGNPDKVTSVQTTVGLFNFEATPGWKLFVDGQKVEQLPFKTKFGAKITIHDGVSYVGLIPIPASDLGRDIEVEIVNDGVMTLMQGGGKAREAIRINAYNYRSQTPLDLNRADLDLAYAGYVFEAGDSVEYQTFDAFQKHIENTKLTTNWDADKKQLDVSYLTGKDTLHCAYKPAYSGGAPTTNAFPVREVNGKWPYNAPGMERDSTLTQQGTTGHLEKNSATLTSEPGHMTYLLTEPGSGTYMGLNPFSDPTFWEMNTPGGIGVKADGRLGMTRVIVRPKENSIWVDYDAMTNATRPDMATSLLVFGLKIPPVVELNGQALQANPQLIEGKTAYVIPLNGKTGVQTTARFAKAQLAIGLHKKGEVKPNAIQDWYLAGPFALDFDKAFEPELKYSTNKLDLQESYKGLNDTEVKWQHINEGKAPGSGVIDLNSRFKPNQNVTVYAYTRIVSDRDCDASLLTGSDDGIVVWLNGRKVQSQNVWRGAVMDSDRVAVKLKKGENTILVKVTQGGGGFGFILRLADAFGLPLEGIHYSSSAGIP